MNSIRTYFTNNFVFNNPNFEYKKTNLNSKSIIFIKRCENLITNDGIDNYIPCLFIQEREQSSKFLIFFHGNSEDIFMSELLGQYFSEKLKMNVIIVEYPGYSIYNAEKSAETMCYDSLIVYSFIKDNFNLSDDDIYVLGRSIGTGPAVFLSSKKKPRGLILVSPFKSIKSVKGAFIGFFLLDIFKSIDIIDKVTSPVLFIHGKNDHLIDYKHSEELFQKLDTYSDMNKNQIIINPNMTHNDMDIEKDIFNRIIEFVNINTSESKKRCFNFLDKKFKKLFDIPLPVQNYLLTLNISLENPNIISKNSRFCLLLNDERVAYSMKNYQIEIYDPEEMDMELTIKTSDIGQINFLSQLSNDILIACSDYYIGFYILKKFKYEKKKSIEFKNTIISVEELNNSQILVLTKRNIILLNNEYEIKNEYKNNNFQNMKVLKEYIALKLPNKILILSYKNNEINKKKEIMIEESIIKDDIINIENKYLIYLDNNNINQLIFEDKDEIYHKIYKHSIENPSFIFNLYHNIVIIGNEYGDIQIYEINRENIKSLYFEKNKLDRILNNSIIALKDGKIMISFDEKKKYEIKEEINNKMLDECKLI